MKFNCIVHDNQSKSMKKYRVSRLSCFSLKRKMDEIKWPSDFNSDLFLLTLANCYKIFFQKAFKPKKTIAFL